MKSAWIRIIKKHTISIEGNESGEGLPADFGRNPGHRVVRDWKYTDGDADGLAFLEVYPIQPMLGDRGPHLSRPHCFIAYAVDMAEDDFLILHSLWNRDHHCVCYLPWQNIAAIRYVVHAKKEA